MAEQGEKKKQSGFKIFLKVMAMFVLLGYIIFSFYKQSSWNNNNPCQSLVICITDSAHAAFVSKEDIQNILDKKHLNPVGIPMDNISLPEMEKAIKKHQFVLNLHCYKTADNAIHVDIEQRLPVMRIMSQNGDNYFIDGNGDKMTNVNYPADVIVATGVITPKYAKKHLAAIGKIVQQSKFWDSQIEQFNVLPGGTIELIPRVGNQVVYLGKPENISAKLNKLKNFYDKVLCRVGWNKYSRIDLQYSNQIVCTKTE